MGGTDALLVARLAAGDDEALTEIFDQFAPGVYRQALQVLRGGTAAQDVVQDVFVELWRRPDRYDPAAGSLRAYLAVMARHRAVDLVRSELRRLARQDRHHRLTSGEVPSSPPEQVLAAEAASGRSLYNGGQPYGSELGWAGNFVQPAGDTAAPGDTTDAAIALNYLKYMAFLPNPPASFTLADVKFTDEEFARLNLLGDAIYNANHPDLRAFAARGGKLILYHGWADPTIPPWSTLDYYAAVERASGGFRASQAFSRLYMIPGAGHCLYTPDPKSINLADFLTPLISWVQHRTAPGTVEADTLSLTTYQITLRQQVRPYNALAPVTPAPGSLNGHYHYLGT